MRVQGQTAQRINVEYKLKKKNLNYKERHIAVEVKKNFLSTNASYKNHQRSSKDLSLLQKAIEDVKSRTTPRINEKQLRPPLAQTGVQIPSVI